MSPAWDTAPLTVSLLGAFLQWADLEPCLGGGDVPGCALAGGSDPLVRTGGPPFHFLQSLGSGAS